MRVAALGLALIGLLATAAFAADRKPADGPARRLHGSWAFKSIVDGGETIGPDLFTGRGLKFDGLKIAFQGAPGDSPEVCPRGTFTLSPERPTGWINVKFEGVEHTSLGLYEVTGDQLRICINLADGDRPKAFESPEASRVLLMTLTRQKK